MHKQLKRLVTGLILVFSLCLALASVAMADASGTITDNCVRIRTKPSTDSEVYQHLHKGNTVAVLDAASDGWVKISFTYEGDGSTKTGYVSEDFIKVDGEAPAEETSAETEQPKEELTPDKEGAPKEEKEQKTKTEKTEKTEKSTGKTVSGQIPAEVSATATVGSTVNLREKATKKSQVLTELSADSIVFVLSDESADGWVKVKYYDDDGNKVKGYVISSALEPNRIGKGVSNTASAIIRAEAKAEAEMVGVVPEDGKVSIYQSSKGMYRVEYDGMTGWVDADCIDVQAESDCYGYGKPTSEHLRLRAERSLEADILGEMDGSTVLQLLKLKDGWYKTTYNGQKGHVYAEYVKVLDSCAGGYVQVTASSLYLRSGAGKDYAPLASIPGGTVLETKGSVGSWYVVTYGKYTGFISGEYVSATGKGGFSVNDDGSSKSNAIVVTASSLNFRNAPSEDGKKIGSLPYGTKLKILDEENGWYKISYDGKEGYVCMEYAGAPSPEDETRAAPSSNSSGSGSALSYASQFVGNPYVWGGTSLTNGCDCSGFVMSIFAQYGVSLPHSSAAIRGCGKSVSYSEMQPGDVVCYSGHVGIYAGNGQLLSALNKKKGITYCSVNYKKILSIRRML